MNSRDLRPLGLVLLVSLVVWQVPFGTYLLYPFKLLGTWLHEGSHGLVMAVTGAGFDRMEVYRDGSGLAYSTGTAGSVARAAIAAAGYMGAPAWGVAILGASRSVRGARWAVGVLGGALALSALLVISNRFGQVTVAIAGGVALAIAVFLPARAAVSAAYVVAGQACINAVVDIRVLYRPVLVIDGRVVRDSDAHAMAAATLGTTDNWGVWLWASIWLAWSFAILFAVFWIAQRRARTAAQ